MSRQQRLTLIATILGSTVVFLDGTIVNVALPSIGRELNAGLAGQQWVVEAYMLTMVSLLLVGGSLGDQFGRRRLFVIGLVAFGATSILCALAPTEEFLIGARALQGIAGALLVPGSLAIVAATFAGEERGQGGRDLDGVDRDRDRVRPGGRRRAGRADLLAGDLLGQHPADRGDRDADPARGRGVERPRRLPRHRRPRRAALGGGPGRPGLRA